MKSNIKRKAVFCDLYTVTNSDGKILANKLYSAQIIGKSLIIGLIVKDHNTHGTFYNEYLFEYSYNIPFNKKVTLKGKKEKQLNTKITYKGLVNNSPFEQICYTSLNGYQRIINSYNFRRLWIQQSNSIMWIINLLVAILAILATFASICRY
jgi:hypothetical protein